MDDDDESRDKGRKTNTDRDFKPTYEKRQGFAPRGMVGRPSVGAPSRKEPIQATTKHSVDNRPYAVKTGVDAIDKQSIENGFQLKTEAELKAMAQPEKKQPDRPQVSQSDYAKAFRQAHGPMRSRQQSRTIEPE